MAETFDAWFLGLWLTLLLALLGMEQLRDLRRVPARESMRWVPNLGLHLAGSGLLRWLLPVGTVALALQQSPGALQRAGLPALAELLVAFLLLDGLNYGVHRLLHRNALLWPLHKVHHSDLQLDVTTSVRHHPLEALLAAATEVSAVLLLGLPAGAVALHAVAGALVALWSHANLTCPRGIERALNAWVATPAVHRIHHSAWQPQTDSNYGTILTVWDRLFGTYRDPELQQVRHLGLETLRQPDDQGFWALLVQPFRRVRGPIGAPIESAGPAAGAQVETPESARRPAASAPASARAWWQALRATALSLALIAPVLASTAFDMAVQWTTTESYRSGWLVLPMLAYLLGWHWRDELRAATPSPAWAGVVLASAAALLWNVAHLMNVDVGRQLAFILVLHGILWATVGWRLYRRLFPSLLLLFFMVPSGDLLQPYLRRWTTAGLDLVLSGFGLPVAVQGFSLSVGSHHYVVADACSGLSQVTLMAFLGYCFGLLLFRSLWKVVALSLLAGLLGVLSNLLRVNAIVLVDRARGSQMDLAAHGHVQWLVLMLVMLALLYGITRLPLETWTDEPGARGGARPLVRSRFVPATAAGLAVLVVVGTGAWVVRHADFPAPMAGLPAGWDGWEPAGMQRTQPARLPSEVSTQAMAYRRNERDLHVGVAQVRSLRFKVSAAALDPLVSGAWHDAGVEIVRACSPDGCTPMIHTTWRFNRKTLPRHVYEAYSVGEVTTTSQLELRAATAWYWLTGRAQGPRLIRLGIDGAVPAGAELHRAHQAIVRSLRPQ